MFIKNDDPPKFLEAQIAVIASIMSQSTLVAQKPKKTSKTVTSTKLITGTALNGFKDFSSAKKLKIFHDRCVGC